MNTLQIQEALGAFGFSPGPFDGEWGRRTMAAVKLFQASKGINPSGIVGPLTLAALGLTGQASSLRPWLDEARKLQNTIEGPGSKDNPVILNWADDLDIHYPHDEIPWCGLFVAHCIGATLPDEPLPSNPLGARNWKSFGQTCQPTLGAVMVFWRTSKVHSYNGHVGFYVGQDSNAFHILGGNQGDRVSIARVAKVRLLAARYPTSVALPPVVLTSSEAAGGALSKDEA